MVYIKRLTLLILLTLSSLSVTAQSTNAISQRIAPVGDVYLNGEIATPSANSADKESGPRSPEHIYNTYCVACHGSGAAGAPIKGEADAWRPRLAKGRDTLNKHAIEGFNNLMPARGTCMDCSDDEIIGAVDLLIKGL